MIKISRIWLWAFILVSGMMIGFMIHDYFFTEPTNSIVIQKIKQKKNSGSTITIPIEQFQEQEKSKKELRIERRLEKIKEKKNVSEQED